MSGHPASMRTSPATALGGESAEGADARASAPRFEDVYEQHMDYVWRVARRLGMAGADLDDVVQDVFVAVHRRLGDFQGRSSLRTWLYGIAIRVVRDRRRRDRRKPSTPLGDQELPGHGADPERQAQSAEQQRLLLALLDTLDHDKREIFVLTELEELSAPQIAEILELNLNTVYARLRAARREFDRALTRMRARGVTP
ncbi:MAG: sigma-70 family RNA polymerase sigma factor [Myxococcales bacterium]|nr:sigma-70 family RNA polymerase sigma factor [Myxococcales bacterium]